MNMNCLVPGFYPLPILFQKAARMGLTSCKTPAWLEKGWMKTVAFLIYATTVGVFTWLS